VLCGKIVAYREMNMTMYNFLWPIAKMNPDYRQRVEASITTYFERVRAPRMLCHEGPAEVSIALGMPMGRSLRAVVVCSCGIPRATMEGQGSEPDNWKVAELANA
jgi:hypothetical protein